MSAPQTHYFAREISDLERLRAVVEEGQLRDGDVDAIERAVDEAIDPTLATSLALVLGRAGRPSSRAVLDRLTARLGESGAPVDAMVSRMATALLAPRPVSVEQAESGYRWRDPVSADELFIEDPVAAHWHAKDRWGPPLRVDPWRRAKVAKPTDSSDALFEVAAGGGIVVVTFAPPRWLGSPKPPLRLTRAGLARDPALRSLVRWSTVRSVGVTTRRGRRSVGFESVSNGDAPSALPSGSSLGPELLASLMGRLLELERGPAAPRSASHG